MDCRNCRIPMTPATAAIEGEAGGIHIAIPNFPFYRCERCGAHALVDPDFNMFMLDAIMDATPTPKKGGFGRKLACAKCGADVSALAASPQSFSATLSVRQRYPMDITVRGPGVVCAACGTAQLQGTHRIAAGNITESLLVAFKPLEPLNPWKVS